MRLLLILGLFISINTMASDIFDGSCTFDTTNPRLPKAICDMPKCSANADCEAPTINRDSATIEYNEPLLLWMQNCPLKRYASCWEFNSNFHLRIEATDPSGIDEIGVVLNTEFDAERPQKTYWGKATQKDKEGRYLVQLSHAIYVPANKKLVLSLYELCAKDKVGNRTCVLPKLGQSRNQ